MNLQSFVFNRDVNGAGYGSPKTLVAGNPGGMSPRQTVSPPGALLLHQVERRAQFLRFGVKELATICNRICLGSRRQFVNQSLHDERSMCVPDRTPPEHRNVDSWIVCRDVKVREVVAGVCGAFDSGLVDAVLNHHGGKRSSGNQRLADHDMTPGRRHSIRADANLDAMRMHGTIVTAT